MSRQAPLPPRCPIQKKTTIHPANYPLSQLPCKDIDLHDGDHRDRKSIPQSSILEEQPIWLDDLLSDSDSNSTGILHRRAASDSLTFFDGLVPLPGLNQLNETETQDSCDPDGLEASCAYGPNSPRRKDKCLFPENKILSAFPEYILQNTLQHLEGNNSVSGIPQSVSFGNACVLGGEMYTENKLAKRHPAQRSRVRKLQYIAELEKTVRILQNVGSELAVRVSSMLQQHAALSVENNTLKQQLLRVQHEKYILDGEYQSLKNEVQRLKTGLTLSSNNQVRHGSRSAAYLSRPETIREMLDIGKLSLN
ncbi:basic leucine zipper 34 [Sesamum indicum]|uniref:Basic leucine zipper 34 n=1 Tax=Sesamum indicum TaxID=4182 RepID=A0A6I9TSI1_SESIN|nr:basic leucine zipper 34 [Sesamum indicum]